MPVMANIIGSEGRSVPSPLGRYISTEKGIVSKNKIYRMR